MKDKEKNIEEIETIIKSNLAEGSFASAFAKKVAIQIVEYYQSKLPKDSVVLSREEYQKDFSNQFNKGYKHGSKETAEKILNIEFFVFETENRSEEYQKGYMQAVRECRSRKDELAKQLGVEIKE